jgi:hypothetical protein
MHSSPAGRTTQPRYSWNPRPDQSVYLSPYPLPDGVSGVLTYWAMVDSNDRRRPEPSTCVSGPESEQGPVLDPKRAFARNHCHSACLGRLPRERTSAPGGARCLAYATGSAADRSVSGEDLVKNVVLVLSHQERGEVFAQEIADEVNRLFVAGESGELSLEKGCRVNKVARFTHRVSHLANEQRTLDQPTELRLHEIAAAYRGEDGNLHCPLCPKYDATSGGRVGCGGFNTGGKNLYSPLFLENELLREVV